MKIKIFILTLLSVPLTTIAQIQNSVLSNGLWYKISVNETGIYRITYNELTLMGINVSSINPKNIRIYGNPSGMLPEKNNLSHPDDIQELAIKVIGEEDNIFNVNDYILFYGQSPVTWRLNQDSSGFEHKVNLYSDNTFYFLNFDSGIGKRIQQNPSLNVTPTDSVSTFDDHLYHEADLYNFIKSGKEWYGEHFDIVTLYNFSFNFPNIIQTTPVKINASFAARSSVISHFTINSNGQSITPISVPASSMTSSTDPFAKIITFNNSFSSGSDFINLQITYDKPNSSSQGWLNYIEIFAKRNLIMNGDQMCFRVKQNIIPNHTSKYNLTTNPVNTEIWDVTDISNIQQQMAQQPLSGNVFSFITNTENLKVFIAFKYQNFKTPEFSGLINNQNLHGLPSANLMIVTDESFLTSANTLADFHRNHDNLSVQVATTKQIYNEFSTGSQDISAIRNFIRMLYYKGTGSSSELKYILLFGDASYDYKNRISGNTNFVPTFESANSLDPINSYLSDDFFALLDSSEGNLSPNEVLDIGIGRLPVKNINEASATVSKIIKYVSDTAGLKNWRTDLCFIGDDADSGQHQAQANELANRIDTMQPCYNIYKIFLDDFVQDTSGTTDSYPQVNAAINNRVEKGTLIINYTGHGNEQGLAHEHILTIPMIESWTNTNNLPFFITATCEFGRFDNPDTTSSAELIFLQPNGGGIGLMTTSRLVYSGPNYSLNLSFYDHAFTLTSEGDHYRLGDIIRLTKNNNSGMIKRNFTLLGDPALILVYPKYQVFTTHINGNSIQNTLDTLYPGNALTITGYVADNSNLIMTNFNGTIHFKMFDKERTDTTLGNDPQTPPMIFHRQDSVLMEGYAIVTNGLFEISTTIPGNIGPGYGRPKFSFYAENQQYDAMGCFEDLEIYGYVAGINKNEIRDFSVLVYPTATSDYLFCESENINFNNMIISVCDLTGRNIILNDINKSDKNKISVNVSFIENGMYFITFTKKNKTISKKFIKK